VARDVTRGLTSSFDPTQTDIGTQRDASKPRQQIKMRAITEDVVRQPRRLSEKSLHACRTERGPADAFGFAVVPKTDSERWHNAIASILKLPGLTSLDR
jgi:hypothetical protein